MSSLSSIGGVTALAVSPTGDMFVKDSEAAGVREFEPNGTEMSTQFDAGSTSVTSITLDGLGDVFVGDEHDGFHVLKYTSSGKVSDSFGLNPARVSNFKDIAFSESLGELYVGEASSATEQTDVSVLAIPAPGPVVESVSASPGLKGTVTLKGVVNPEGNSATYRFEYVDAADFKASGYADASSTSSISIGSSLEGQSVSVHITGLPTSTTYHYRVVASNSEGSATGADQAFETLPPALIDAEYTADVSSTSATFDAKVNPLGSSTEYRLEYGTGSSYGHTLTGNAGEGTTDALVGYHVQELLPSTTYHYRFATTSALGTVEGVEQVFTTQPTGGELALPDGRAWELVSPPDKKGALIEQINGHGDVQAANDGSGITYVARGPSVGEGPRGYFGISQLLSMRDLDGWRTTNLVLPRIIPKGEGEEADNLYTAGNEEYRLFSSDLSLGTVEPFEDTPSLSPEATERTLYLRDSANGSFLPLLTPTNVLVGTEFGSSLTSREHSGRRGSHFLAATPDLSHVLLESTAALTPEAMTESFIGKECTMFGGLTKQQEDEPFCASSNLYEWSSGELRLVNILPNGEPTQTQIHGDPNNGVWLGGTFGDEGPAVRAMSNDGRRIVWTVGNPYGEQENGGTHTPYEGLFVRDMVEERTVQVSGAQAVFQLISADGSKVFYREGNDLQVFDVDAGTRTDITANYGAGEPNGGVKEVVLGASEDGSYVYFVATGVLAEGGVKGKDNLYVSHDNNGEWTTTYIATLSSEDEPDWFAGGDGGSVNLSRISSRVSPNGRYLEFMSDMPLIGYDNTDAVSGQPDEEVYLYDADAVSNRLVCASCDPTGARPVGVLDQGGRLTVDRGEAWSWNAAHDAPQERWLAGIVPSPGFLEGGIVEYQPRYLSDDGRLFFDSPDALVPQATNGLNDVYEYEPVGDGSCAETNVTFGAHSRGCVNLISAGTSSGESAFLDASENGDDAFFLTSSRLAATDYDTSYDVYDAHVCSTEVPCVSVPVSSPPCISGDSCKAAPSPQPEVFGATPSATFSGTGNVVEEAKPKSASKSKSRRKPKKKAKSKKKKRKAKKAVRSGASRTSRKGDRRS